MMTFLLEAFATLMTTPHAAKPSTAARLLERQLQARAVDLAARHKHTLSRHWLIAKAKHGDDATYNTCEHCTARVYVCPKGWEKAKAANGKKHAVIRGEAVAQACTSLPLRQSAK